MEEFQPFLGILRLCAGAVVGVKPGIGTDPFEISSGLEILECLAEEPLFIGDAPFRLTAVDEVKLVLVYPVALKVVDFKRAIRSGPICVKLLLTREIV